MNIDLQLPSPLQSLESPVWASSQHIRIKRDDLIHPVVSGNKARKLELLIEQFNTAKSKHLLSMGGNRSNFLHALAYLCHQQGIPLSAFIRGSEPKHYARTLSDLKDWGVKLTFIDREHFKRLRDEPEYAQSCANEMNAQWLPEGGSDANALRGIMHAVQELEQEPDTIFVPVGTGCTALGLALSIKQRGWNSKVIGVVVLKGADGEHGIQQDMRRLTESAGMLWPDNLLLDHSHCGNGFGKQSAELSEQQAYFEQLWSVPLDPVYTVKMCNAFKHYCESKHVNLGKQVLLWHTGGLQGN